MKWWKARPNVSKLGILILASTFGLPLIKDFILEHFSEYGIVVAVLYIGAIAAIFSCLEKALRDAKEEGAAELADYYRRHDLLK